jgi:hypothetical protein
MRIAMSLLIKICQRPDGSFDRLTDSAEEGLSAQISMIGCMKSVRISKVQERH